MSTAVSLHIGLNSVDPNHYVDEFGDPWDGALEGCEFDARDMDKIADSVGIDDRSVLLTSDATSASVIRAIKSAAKGLRSGDYFLLTYSGHGGQVPDTNHDERKLPSGSRDRKDETWALFDRELVDDELYTLWGSFKKGVRIFVLSDSCHSGTVTRTMPSRSLRAGRRVRVRRMPRSVAEGTASRHRKQYREIQNRNRSGDSARVSATVILISGCQDNQFSDDGPRNGLFTSRLKRIWNRGQFSGTHRAFRDQITAQMPRDQTPNYFLVGAPNAAFEAQRPFTV